MIEKPILSTQIKILAVKIFSAKTEQLGSGIIYLPKYQEDKIFIITAKHCICGKEFSFTPESTDIKVEVFSEKNQGYLTYQLTSADQLLYFDENQKDLAILIIDKNRFPISTENIPFIQLIEDSKGIRNSAIFGFPDGSPNSALERVDTILQLPTENFIWKAENQRTLQSEESDSTRTSVQGFSGSGFLLNTLSEYFLFGVVTDFIEWNRFFGVKINLVNALLNDHNYAIEPLHEIEADEEVKKGIDFLNRNSDRILENIKRKSFLGSKKIDLERAEIKKEIIDNLDSQKVVFINGHAGYGKSVLAEKVISSISSIHTTWVIKAEQLTTVDINGFIFNNGSTAKFETILDSPFLFKQKIILVDSTEKLLETQELDGLESLLELVDKRDDLKILFTIRDYALGTMITLPAGAYESIEISGISKLEMEQISKAYPALESLNENKDIAQILKVPFYLNFVLQLLPELLDNENLDERKLKIKLWKKIIEKSNTLRGNVFKRLALKRAREMKYYVPLDDENQVIIGELIKDEIIIRFEDQYGNYSFAPTHDIFEDWALIKFIQSCRDSSNGDIITFYKEIGNAYAIRRGFRFWLHEELKNGDAIMLFSDFISRSLDQTEVDTYWKDEILVSVLLSPYCTNFLSENEDEILANDAQLLIKIIHLLRTACRKPFKSVLPDDKQDQESKLYSFNFEPIGDSWVSIITFIYQNQTILETNHILVLRLFLDWGKKLYKSFHIPDESRMVGELILKILRQKNIIYLRGLSGRDNGCYEKAISLLFRLTEIMKDEISQILNQSLAYNIKKEERFKERRKQHDKENYFENIPRVKPKDPIVEKFGSFILKEALSFLGSKKLCYFLPDLIINMAKELWLEKGENPEEYYNGIGTEEYFGIVKEGKTNYFPASAYKTPTYFLLKFHPEKGLQFILDIVNCSTQCYKDSSLAERNKVELVYMTLKSGKKISILGDLTLWTMYRDTDVGAAKPSVLQCMLMALEKWMLTLGRSKNKRHHEVLVFSVEKLLEESNSAMTAGVVSSVSMAFPSIIKMNILPLFSVIPFFLWDRMRHVCRNRNFDFTFPFDSFHREERQNALKEKHRNKSLESFILELSLQDEFVSPIYSILDNHYDDLRNLAEPNKIWELALNRIDIRTHKFEINPENSNSIITSPVVDEKLKAFFEKEETQREKERPALDSSSWAHNVMKKGILDSNTFDNWKTHQKSVLASTDKTYSFLTQAFKSNGSIAFIGLKYHVEKLDSDEIKWCFNTLLDIGKENLHNDGNENVLAISAGLLNDEALIKALPLMLKLAPDKETLSVTKKNIINFLFRLELTDNIKRPFFLVLAEQIWGIDYDFAIQCFRAMYHYAKLNKPIRNYRYSKNYESEKKIFESEKDDLIEKAINNDLEEILKFDITLELLGSFSLDKVFSFLPERKSFTKELEVFRRNYERVLISSTYKKKGENEWNSRNELSHSIRFYQPKAASLLYLQETEHAKESLLILLNYILDVTSLDHLSRETSEFFTYIFSHLINLENIFHNKERFWFIWKIVYDQSRKSTSNYFAGTLLLKNEFQLLTLKQDWSPLHGQLNLIKKIVRDFGGNDINATVDLLSGAGAMTLLPKGILWIKDLIEKNNGKISSDIFYYERLVQRAYFIHRRKIQEDSSILNAYIYILDVLVDAGSSSAYYLRNIVMSRVG